MLNNNHCYSSSNIKLFLSFDNYLYCSDCQVKPETCGEEKYNYVAYNTGVMLHHLERHKAYGHDIPKDLKNKLLADDYMNFPEGGTQGGCFLKMETSQI